MLFAQELVDEMKPTVAKLAVLQADREAWEFALTKKNRSVMGALVTGTFDGPLDDDIMLAKTDALQQKAARKQAKANEKKRYQDQDTVHQRNEATSDVDAMPTHADNDGDLDIAGAAGFHERMAGVRETLQQRSRARSAHGLFGGAVMIERNESRQANSSKRQKK